MIANSKNVIGIRELQKFIAIELCKSYMAGH